MTGTTNHFYTYTELTTPRDKDQAERDNNRIAWIKANYKTNLEKVIHKISSNEFDDRILLRLINKDPEIKSILATKEFEVVWKEKLKHNSNYHTFKLEGTDLCDIWLGLSIFEYYKKYKNNDKENEPAAKELLDEACKRNILAALQRRCLNAIKDLNEKPSNNLDQYMQYADDIAQRYHTIGHLEAARIYFRIGQYLDRKLSTLAMPGLFSNSRLKINDCYQYTLFGTSIKRMFMKGFTHLHEAQQIFNTHESQQALEIAFGKGQAHPSRLFSLYNLPETVQDFVSATQFFESCYQRYIKPDDLAEIQQAEFSHQSASPAA